MYCIFIEQQRTVNGRFIGSNMELTPGYNFSERERCIMCVHCSIKCVKSVCLNPHARLDSFGSSLKNVVTMVASEAGNWVTRGKRRRNLLSLDILPAF